MKKDEFEIVDAVEVRRDVALTSAERRIAEAPVVGLRVIPRHKLAYSLTLIVNGNPYPISDAHAQEIGMFASVDQKIGKITNSGDRSAALVVLLPRGTFGCINLDDPDSTPSDFGNRRDHR